MTEIAIVGAGPSGASAAYRLARAGARVTIFDPSHPREKPCGGGVTGRALALVADAVDQAAVPSTRIRAARFVDTPRRLEAVVRLDGTGDPGGAALIVASRRTFDAALLAAALRAGAEHCPARVADVRVDGSAAYVTTDRGERRVDFLVGADGATSIVRRRLADPFGRDRLSIATGFFADGVTSDEIVIELVGDPPGYIWSFPRPDHLAIGICAPADAGAGSAALRARAAEWIRKSGIAGSAPLRQYSWPIPTLSESDCGRLTVAGPRWCVLGDAAGLVDPITREGIYFAIASGGWAAEAILGVDAGRRYGERVRDEAAPELARAARFKAAFFRPEFSALLIEALRRSGAIRTVMADLVAGRQSYRTLKWRLARTLEVGVAWRTLRAALRSYRP